MKQILNILLGFVLLSCHSDANNLKVAMYSQDKQYGTTFKLANSQIDIYRQNNKGCLSGYISINGEIIGYSVERPDVDNINDISAIPTGDYGAHVREEGKLKWRLELEDVSGGRENVQIHVGNYINVIDEKTGLERCSIKGCIIIGETLGSDLCSVFNSKKALNKLEEKINENNIPNLDKIIVSIH